MAKSRKKPLGEEQAMTPEMRKLILSFDAKDRRDEEAAKKTGQKSKDRRRRSDSPARAA